MNGLAVNVIYGSPDVVNGADIGIVSNVRKRLIGLQFQALMGMGEDVNGVVVCGFGCKSSAGYAVTLSTFVTFVHTGGGGQVSLFNKASEYTGIQIGFLNWTLYEFTGVQFGVLNFNNIEVTQMPTYQTISVQVSDYRGHTTTGTATVMTDPGRSVSLQGANTGLFVGLANSADKVTGAQVGAVNVSREHHGVQIGIVNFTRRLYGVQFGLANIAWSNVIPFLPGVLIGW